MRAYAEHGGLGTHARVTAAQVQSYTSDWRGVCSDPSFTTATILCDTVTQRVEVHAAAEALGLASAGVHSTHDGAQHSLWWRCPLCKAWSQAERWNAGGGMCALADRLPGESYAQAFAREESESDTALCPVCDKWASRCWEGESCACARGKARCDLHVSVSEAHNAVFVCAGKLPVKLGRGRRRRANRRRARDRDELLAPQ